MSPDDRRRDLLSAIAICERYGQTDMAAAYAAEIRALDQHDNGAGTPKVPAPPDAQQRQQPQPGGIPTTEPGQLTRKQKLMTYQQSTPRARGGAGLDELTPVQQRQQLAARGWHLFPLIPGTKRPGVQDWENKATTDPNHLGDWPTGAGAGIACGPSGLVVIDLDAHDGDRPAEWARPGIHDGADVFAAVWAEHETDAHAWARTYVVTTPSGGGHLYYRAPAREVRNSAGRIGWQVDVRARGGYVVAPGTTLPAGAYETLSDPGGLPMLPEWLTGLLVDHRPAPHRSQRRVLALPSHSGKRVNALARTVATAAEGQRNDTLNWAAYQLAQDAALTQEHAAVLLDAAKAAGLTEAEAVATIRSAGREVTAR